MEGVKRKISHTPGRKPQVLVRKAINEAFFVGMVMRKKETPTFSQISCMKAINTAENTNLVQHSKSYAGREH